MELQDIKDLMKDFQESQLTYLRVEDGDQKLVMKQGCASTSEVAIAPQTVARPTAAPVAEETGFYPVKAPMVGVFYAAKSPDAPSFVVEGQQVTKGDVLCLVEAMKQMSELQSPVTGIVRRILVENEAFIQFDQPLFMVEETPC